MSKLENLLAQITCKKTYLRKSTMTSGNAYLVTLTYKGKWCKFVFNDNIENKSGKSMFIYCLVNDAQAFESCRDWVEFKREYGYTRDTEAKHVYKACEMQSNRLHRLFTETEIEVLSEIE